MRKGSSHEHADAARRPPPDRILGFLHGSIQNVPKAPSVRNRNILPGGDRRTAAAWSCQTGAKWHRSGAGVKIKNKNQKPKNKLHFAPAYCNPLFTKLYLFPQQNSLHTNMPTPLGGPRLTESLDFCTDRSRMFQRLRLSEIVTFCQAGTAEQPRHGRARLEQSGTEVVLGSK